jgi:L-rhamnose mutarotase
MSQAVRRFAQIVKLKPQHLAEYKDVHARVWPDVLAQIKQCNIKDCTDMTKHS